MKSINIYINEALKLGNKSRYKYHPKTTEELKYLINPRIEQDGNKVDLNDIDVSKITDMSYLFAHLDFNGDISKWDVSNVKYMNCMFYYCISFNQDISNWDVSGVKDYIYIFDNCQIEEKYKPKFK